MGDSSTTDELLASWDALAERYLARARSAFEAETAWGESVRALVLETLRLAEAHPAEARLLALEIVEAGEPGRVRRDGLLDRLTEFVDAGRGVNAAAAEVPRSTAEGIVGGAYLRICARLRRGEDMAGLAPELVAFAITPYLGLEAGLAELE